MLSVNSYNSNVKLTIEISLTQFSNTRIGLVYVFRNYKGIFRTLSNFEDGAFCENSQQLTYDR